MVVFIKDTEPSHQPRRRLNLQCLLNVTLGQFYEKATVSHIHSNTLISSIAYVYPADFPLPCREHIDLWEDVKQNHSLNLQKKTIPRQLLSESKCSHLKGFLHLFSSPRRISFHVVFPIASGGCILPFLGYRHGLPSWAWRVVGLAGGLAWEVFRVGSAHPPTCWLRPMMWYTVMQQCSARPAQTRASHSGTQENIKYDHEFLITHSTVRSHTWGMRAVTQPGRQLMA